MSSFFSFCEISQSSLYRFDGISDTPKSSIAGLAQPTTKLFSIMVMITLPTPTTIHTFRNLTFMTINRFVTKITMVTIFRFGMIFQKSFLDLRKFFGCSTSTRITVSIDPQTITIFCQSCLIE